MLVLVVSFRYGVHRVGENGQTVAMNKHAQPSKDPDPHTP